MDLVLFYVLPSISAISIKLLIVWYGRRTFKTANGWLWGFLGGLFCLNLFELITFFGQVDHEGPLALVLLKLYYVAAIVTAAAYLAFSFELTACRGVMTKSITYFLMFSGLAAILFPGAAIVGVQSIGYSVTRIAGPYYWVVQLVICASTVIGTGVLMCTSKMGGDWLMKRRAIALLVGAVPTVVSVLFIMVLMHLGYKINATVIVSLTVNILLGVLIYTEYENGLFKFLSFIPATPEYRLSVNAAQAAYKMNSEGLTTAVHSFEKALVSDALEKCEGNRTSAAELLGVSRTTLRRKMTGYDNSTQ